MFTPHTKITCQNLSVGYDMKCGGRDVTPNYIICLSSVLSSQKKRWMIAFVLGEVFPAFVYDQLRPLWQHLVTTGTPAQVKLAVRCLCSHINDPVITYNILTVCNFT